MPTIIFRVTSDRIHDMNVEPGKTLKQLTEQLECAGYDVAEAEVKITHPRHNRVGGNTLAYKFKGGECLNFDTTTFDIPAIEQELREEEEQRERDHVAAIYQMEEDMRMSRNTECKCEKCKCGDERSFRIEPCEDGIKIVFKR